VLVPSHEVHIAETGLQANVIVNANAMLWSTEMKMNIQMILQVASGPLWPSVSRTCVMWHHYKGEIEIVRRVLHRSMAESSESHPMML
jgi:hypothetical protein